MNGIQGCNETRERDWASCYNTSNTTLVRHTIPLIRCIDDFIYHQDQRGLAAFHNTWIGMEGFYYVQNPARTSSMTRQTVDYDEKFALNKVKNLKAVLFRSPRRNSFRSSRGRRCLRSELCNFCVFHPITVEIIEDPAELG